MSKKVKRRTLLLWNGSVFHVTGFGYGQNQVLSTHIESAQCTKSRPLNENDKKLFTVLRRILYRNYIGRVLVIFGLISAMFLSPIHTISMTLGTQEHLWASNDCANFFRNCMDNF